MFKTNEIYEFIAVEQRYDELIKKIDNACKVFCDRNFQTKYCGWNFNDRKTLIEITHSYTKHGEEQYDYVFASFDEILSIMNENEPQVK